MKVKSEFSRNILTLMTGTTIAQAIPIAISPILTRIYTPEDFGVFAFFIAIVAIFSSISSARYEQAILLPMSEENALHVFALGFVILSFISLFLLLTIFIVNDFVVSLLPSTEIVFFIYFIPITVFFVGLFNLLSYFNNRKKLYSDISKATVLKAVVLAVVQIVIGLVKEGASGLITGQILSQIVANVKLAKNVFLHKDLRAIFDIKSMWTLSKEYIDFPKYQVPHVLFSTLSSNLPIYLFTLFFSSLVTGLYALAIRIVLSPMMIIAGSSAKVYNEQLSKLYENREDTYGFTLQFLKSLGMKVVVFIVLIALFAPDIFAFVFGESWREAGEYTRLLSPWLFLNVMVSSVAFIPSIVGKQKKAFLMSIVQLILTLSAIGIGVFYESVEVALIAYMLVNSLVLMYNLIWFVQALKFPLYEECQR